MRKTNTLRFVHPVTNAATVMQIADSERPFDNNFVVLSIAWDPTAQELACYVRCTKNSYEPGRIYSVGFTLQGRMTDCCTVN